MSSSFLEKNRRIVDLILGGTIAAGGAIAQYLIASVRVVVELIRTTISHITKHIIIKSMQNHIITHGVVPL